MDITSSLADSNGDGIPNDIDVKVIGSNSTSYYPFRYIDTYGGVENDAKNDADNVEYVCVDDPWGENPNFTVRISAPNSLEDGEPQLVSVIITGDAAAVVPTFRIVNFEESGPTSRTLTWLSEAGGVYQIQSSEDLDGWTTLQGEIMAINDMTSTEVNLAGLGDSYFFRVLRIE